LEQTGMYYHIKNDFKTAYLFDFFLYRIPRRSDCDLFVASQRQLDVRVSPPHQVHYHGKQSEPAL
jgi:hypothetical protein